MNVCGSLVLQVLSVRDLGVHLDSVSMRVHINLQVRFMFLSAPADSKRVTIHPDDGAINTEPCPRHQQG